MFLTMRAFKVWRLGLFWILLVLGLALPMGCLFGSGEQADIDTRIRIDTTTGSSRDTLSQPDTTASVDTVWKGTGAYQFPDIKATTQFWLDSSYDIRWIPAPTTPQGPVKLSLFQADTSLSTLITGLPSQGSTRLQLSMLISSGGKSFGSGIGYRFKITSIEDSTLQGWSAPFSVLSPIHGEFKLTSLQSGMRIRTGDSLFIQWTFTGNVGTDIGLALYQGNTWIRSVVPRVEADKGSYLWKPVSPGFGSGDDYRIRIYSLQNPTVEAFGPNMTILYEPTGRLAFTSPEAGLVVQMDERLPVGWTVEGDVGNDIQLTWWRDNPRDSVMGHTPIWAASGSGTLPIPPEVTPGAYRLRMATFPIPIIQVFSPPFIVE